MKLYLRYCFTSLLCFSLYSSTLAASNSISSYPVKVSTQDSGFLFLNQYRHLTPKKFKQITGQRMTISQRISLFFVKQKMKHQSLGSTSVNADFKEEVKSLGFNWGGFLLGLFLNIAGLLISYLIGDKRKIKWAWIGFAISTVLLLLLFIL